jgi:hypothetical protein
MASVLHDPSVADALRGRGGHHPAPQREAVIPSRVEPGAGGGSAHDASDGLRSQPGLGEPSVTIHENGTWTGATPGHIVRGGARP